MGELDIKNFELEGSLMSLGNWKEECMEGYRERESGLRWGFLCKVW